MKNVGIVLIFFAALVVGAVLNPEPPAFGPTVYYPIPPQVYRTGTFLKTADVNHDGFADVIIVGPGSEGIAVWLGDGSGKLKNRVDSEIGEVVYVGGNVAVGDFDGDGNLDLVITMNNSPLQMMKGDGKGGFKRGDRLERIDPIVDCPGPLAAVDLNRDNKLDLVANQCGGGFAVFIGKGDGTFAPAVKVKVPEQNHAIDQSMVVTDFNQDGIPDVAVGTMTGVAVFLGDGQGAFGKPIQLATGFPMKLAAADLNGDGNPDVVVLPSDPDVRPAPMMGSAGNKVCAFLGDGKGEFKPVAPMSVTFPNFPVDGGFPYHLEVVDVNRDQRPDIVLTRQQYSYVTGQPSMRLLVLPGRGDGTFRPPAEYRNPGEIRRYPRFAFAMGDLNGDGRPDLIFLDDRSAKQIGVALNVAKAPLNAAPPKSSPAKPSSASSRKSVR